MLIASVGLVIPAISLAAVVNDEVTSAKLKEADNNGSQDTNSGSGVKTNHLQNKAVTGAKMADGTVTSLQIANGAVTDAKISGPISASKISTTGLNADTLDGLHAGAFSTIMHGHAQGDIDGLPGALAAKADVNHGHDAVYRKRHSSVVVVSKDGTGDFLDPVAAVNSISGASASNPYVVKVLPGDYGITAVLTLRPYVDLEGSGAGITRITWAGAPGAGVAVLLSPDSEVRGLTIAGSGLQVLVSAPTGTRMSRLTGVTVESSSMESIRSYLPLQMKDCEVLVAGSAYGYAVNAQADLWVSNSRIIVDASVEAVGIQVGGGAHARIRGATINATATSQGGVGAGVQVFQATVEIEGSEVLGVGASPQAAVISNTGGSLLYVAHTKVAGQVYTGAPSRCIGVYDVQFAPAPCE
jgi:hypothetical protein